MSCGESSMLIVALKFGLVLNLINFTLVESSASPASERCTRTSSVVHFRSHFGPLSSVISLIAASNPFAASRNKLKVSVIHFVAVVAIVVVVAA